MLILFYAYIIYKYLFVCISVFNIYVGIYKKLFTKLPVDIVVILLDILIYFYDHHSHTAEDSTWKQIERNLQTWLSFCHLYLSYGVMESRNKIPSGGHHSHWDCIQCNNAAWWPPPWRPSDDYESLGLQFRTHQRSIHAVILNWSSVQG